MGNEFAARATTSAPTKEQRPFCHMERSTVSITAMGRRQYSGWVILPARSAFALGQEGVALGCTGMAQTP